MSEPSELPTAGEWLEPGPGVDVGAFEQGSPLSRWAVARYLVGRAIAESVGVSLLIAGLVIVALAAVCEWVLGVTVLAVLLVIVALGVFVLRWLLLTVLRRLTSAAYFGPIEQRLGELVSDTRRDVLRELRRNDLPGHVITLPLLAFGLLGAQRRARNLDKLRGFDLDRVVPRARLDELHLLLRSALRPG